MTTPVYCCECGELLTAREATCGECYAGPMCDYCLGFHNCDEDEEDYEYEH